MSGDSKVNSKQRILKIIAIIATLTVLVLVTLIVAIATYFNYRTSNNINQAKFDSGTISNKQLDGFYEGKNFDGLGERWLGKTFDGDTKTGINTFSDEEKYEFKVYQAQGLRDNRTVIRLDYSSKNNPFWMRFIKDEMVEVSPNNYLGKVTFDIVPGLPFTVTYFELTKSN